MTSAFEIYMAQPYSSAYPAIRRARYREGIRAAAWLTNLGKSVYAPIVHSHPIAEAMDCQPLGWDFWQNIDRRIIEACETVVVLQLEGWRESIGVMAELQYATELGKRINYLIPLENGQYSEGAFNADDTL